MLLTLPQQHDCFLIQNNDKLHNPKFYKIQRKTMTLSI